MQGEVSKADLHNHELVRVTRCVVCIAPDACLCDLTRCEAAGQGQVAVLCFREHMDLPGFATLVNLLLRVSRSRGPRAQRVLYPVFGHVQIAAHDAFAGHVVEEVFHGLVTREKRVRPFFGGRCMVHPHLDEGTLGSTSITE